MPFIRAVHQPRLFAFLSVLQSVLYSLSLLLFVFPLFSSYYIICLSAHPVVTSNKNIMLSKTFTSALALAGLSSASAIARRQTEDTCNGGSPSVVFITTCEVEYPVVINTFIEDNTIITINGGVTININNAPTSLITTVTGTDTVTSTVTVAPPTG